MSSSTTLSAGSTSRLASLTMPFADQHDAEVSKAALAASASLRPTIDQAQQDASYNVMSGTEFDTSSVSGNDDGSETEALTDDTDDRPIEWTQLKAERFWFREKVADREKSSTASRPTTPDNKIIRNLASPPTLRRLKPSKKRSSRNGRKRHRGASVDADGRQEPALKIVCEGRRVHIYFEGVETTYDLFGKDGGVRIVDEDSGSILNL